MAKKAGNQEIPVVDLFAGPGGLGEGFSAALTADGRSAFRLTLSIEQDEAAWETLRLRSFFRQFPAGDAPEEYYTALRTNGPLDLLYDRYPDEFRKATAETWCKKLEEGSRRAVQERIRERLKTGGNEAGAWVLVGGPPCQGYSLVGRSRRAGQANYRPADDERLFLYKEYLHVLATNRPSVFVMENVEGMLSAEVDGDSIFDRILDELREPVKAVGGRGNTLRYELYPVAPRSGRHGTPQNFVVEAEHYSIPQSRHRVIIVGINSEIRRTLLPLTPAHSPITTREVLEGLPVLRSGLSKEEDCDARWVKAVLAGKKEQWFRDACRNRRVANVLRRTADSLAAPLDGRGQKYMPGNFPPQKLRAWFSDTRLSGVCNHESRGHMREDLHRYLFAAAFAEAKGYAPQLPEFPRTLLPKHVNLRVPPDKWKFKDRFKVQVAHEPAGTVTSHISKDGHYYIHYSADQVRSLTVREAARLQTFPDNYYFVRERTHSYHQVGNAVPPLLAKQIAERVKKVLTG